MTSLLSFTQSFHYFSWPFTAARLLGGVFLSHPNSSCTTSMSSRLPSFLGFNSSLGLLITSKLFLMKLLSAGFLLHSYSNRSSYTSCSFLRQQKKKSLISWIGWCLGDSQALTDIHMHDSCALALCRGGEGELLKVKRTTEVWGMIQFLEEGCRAGRFSEQNRSWLQLCHPLVSWTFRIVIF